MVVVKVKGGEAANAGEGKQGRKAQESQARKVAADQIYYTKPWKRRSDVKKSPHEERWADPPL